MELCNRLWRFLIDLHNAFGDCEIGGYSNGTYTVDCGRFGSISAKFS